MRVLWLLSIFALTAYPILELTRLIVLDAFIRDLYPEIPRGTFIFELVVMWVFYISGMVIVYKRMKWNR